MEHAGHPAPAGRCGQAATGGDGSRGAARGPISLESGAADAYASDRVLLAGLLATAKDPARFRLASQTFSYEPYALMTRRGDTAFRVEVNRALASLFRSGQIVASLEGAPGRVVELKGPRPK
jgi:glutamate/aspartate transport system substrate-binding protein